jgi:hypothetical protein
LASTTLKKGITKPSGNPLAYRTSTESITDIVHDIAAGTTSIFYYYGDDYDGVNNSSTLAYPIDVTMVRVVGIRLYMEEDPHLSPAPFIVESKVEIRNLKIN